MVDIVGRSIGETFMEEETNYIQYVVFQVERGLPIEDQDEWNFKRTVQNFSSYVKEWKEKARKRQTRFIALKWDLKNLYKNY